MERKANTTTILALILVCMLISSLVPVISLVVAEEENDLASSGPPEDEFDIITEYESTIRGSPYTTTQYVNEPRPPFGEDRWYNEDFGWQYAFDPDGKQILSVTLEIRAWDVDWAEGAWAEHDAIYADGNYIGEYSGSSNTWSITIFTIDPALLADGQLNIWLDIDSTHNTAQFWASTTDWAKLIVVWVTPRFIDKTLSAVEGELGDVVHVMLTVTTPPDETVTIVDALPGDFRYIMRTFMVDGVSVRLKMRKTDDIIYTITESGTHVIEFDVIVDKAKNWEDVTLCNLVTATWFDEEGEEIETKEDMECFVVHPFEELEKSVDGPLTIKKQTETQWRLIFEVTNPFPYTIADVVITDRFGAEIEIDPYNATQWYISKTHGAAWWDYGPAEGKGKTRSLKVFLTWEIGDLLPSETARLIMLVSTDLNPQMKQEYSKPGIYEMNSGATLKFIDPEQDTQLSATTDSIYVTVLP